MRRIDWVLVFKIQMRRRLRLSWILFELGGEKLQSDPLFRREGDNSVSCSKNVREIPLNNFSFLFNWVSLSSSLEGGIFGLPNLKLKERARGKKEMSSFVSLLNGATNSSHGSIDMTTKEASLAVPPKSP